MVRKKNNYKKCEKEEVEMEKTISQCAFMYRAAIKYDLYATQKLYDLGSQMQAIQPTDTAALIDLLRKMFSYFCGIITFYKLVFGKEVKSEEVWQKIISAFGPGSTHSFLGGLRYSYSYERANQLLGLAKKDFEKDVCFITSIKMTQKQDMTYATWTELKLRSIDGVDANNEQVKEFIISRIDHHEQRFSKVFKTLLPQRFSIELSSMATNTFDVVVESNMKCIVTFLTRKHKPVELTFDPERTFQETIRLKYADEASFNRFYNSMREEWKEVRCSASSEMSGGILNTQEQLFFNKEKRSLKVDDSSVDEDTQEQLDDTVGSSFSNMVETQIQQDEVGANPLYSTEKRNSNLNEETVQVTTNPLNSAENNTTQGIIQQVDDVVDTQTSSSSSTQNRNSNLNEETVQVTNPLNNITQEMLQVIKQKISRYISNAITKKKELITGAIRDLIAFTLKQQQDIEFVQVYLDIYKSVYAEGRNQFEKHNLDRKRELKYKAGTLVTYWGKSELDKAMDSYSKEIKRHLYLIGVDQIEEFFKIFFTKEENLIRPLLVSKKFIDKEYPAKWDEVQRIQFQYNLAAYLNLASRLSKQNHTFLLKLPDKDDVATSKAAKETLMILFEKCIPIEWARDIQPDPETHDLAPITPNVAIQPISNPDSEYWERESTNKRLDLEKEGSEEGLDLEKEGSEEGLDQEESLEGEIQQLTEQRKRLTPIRTIVTRTSAIPVIDLHASWSGNRSSTKRKLESPPQEKSTAAERNTKKGKSPEKSNLLDEIEETPRKERKGIEDLLKNIADEVDRLFRVGTSTKLARTQEVVNVVFNTLTTEVEDKEDYLTGKRIWHFFLPTNDSLADGDLSFIRAHHNMFQKMVVGSESSAQISDVDLMLALDADLSYVREVLDRNRFTIYEKKVESLYSRVVLGSEGEETNQFSEEDLCLPFLYRHLKKLEYLKLFVLDATTNTYKLKALVLNGSLFYGPFRFTDISLKLNLSIFFSPLKTLNATNVDMTIVAEEFGLSVKDVKKDLDRIQSFIRTNEITNEDIDYLARKFLSYAQDKETVLDKSDIPPGSTMTDMTKETTISSISRVPSILDLHQKLEVLIRRKNYSVEIQAEIKELLNELFGGSG